LLKPHAILQVEARPKDVIEAWQQKKRPGWFDSRR